MSEWQTDDGISRIASLRQLKVRHARRDHLLRRLLSTSVEYAQCHLSICTPVASITRLRSLDFNRTVRFPPRPWRWNASDLPYPSPPCPVPVYKTRPVEFQRSIRRASRYSRLYILNARVLGLVNLSARQIISIAGHGSGIATIDRTKSRFMVGCS